MSRHALLATLSALALALVLSAPSPAWAKIGNPIKKAKDAVTKESKKETKLLSRKPRCSVPARRPGAAESRRSARRCLRRKSDPRHHG